MELPIYLVVMSDRSLKVCFGPMALRINQGRGVVLDQIGVSDDCIDLLKFIRRIDPAVKIFTGDSTGLQTLLAKLCSEIAHRSFIAGKCAAEKIK
jgi:hypothetical protein